MREYTKDDYGWFYLDTLDEIPFSKKIKIAVVLENGSKIFEVQNYKDELMEFLTNEEYAILSKPFDRPKLVSLINETKSKNIDFITINSPEYPENFKNVPLPPNVLYYIGDITLLKTKCITMVGSRHCTAYGKTVAEDFSKELAFNGFTIVSGLADGIDTFCHTGCLDVGGKTIAILCGGLNKIYPSINRNLAKQIVASGGLLITEQRVGVESKDFLFPIRNRLLAGICEGVVLIEANEKSGTRHTINHAFEANKSIYCIPHSIYNARGTYNNYLIKESQGLAVSEPKDVITDLGYKCKEKIEYNDNLVKNEMDETAIIRSILEENETVHFDIIQEKSKLDTKKLNSLLTKLELSGIIKKMAGNHYMLRK